ncbi:disulfide bond formation protein B [Gilvimarinus agarilyticus]|uniref:disulfide bond formation protein B n=1 Tax=unclassified Gilvimarinus TaxID=2642066 RepID=UPI001C09E246|nr:MULTISPECIES: disulfide bond formation protein B [unclassified Gilvimarinus]MBU2887529.1 disulfide bond formation protein B [Gilvimarinus agarilyticus]MDO6572180.1 disulfide bond formation protein B [Gilvimarinus sp. 2_MG-2023]MDO6746744.1 disulfide bond formation protein B [Gilvimarinus sp. 1_MG-2023]
MNTTLAQRALSLASCRYFWLAVAAAMLALEGGALYFQYVEHYYPCEMCIYVRVWVAAIFVVSVLALVLKRWFWGRVIASLTGLVLSLGLAWETWGLVKVEYNIGHGSACGFKANFPGWAPLDAWLPALFKVEDLCQATPLVLGPISMTHGLIMISAGLIATMLLALLGCFYLPKR